MSPGSFCAANFRTPQHLVSRPAAIWSLVLAQFRTALFLVATLLFLRALVPAILQILTRAEWLFCTTIYCARKQRQEARDNVLWVVSHELRTAALLATPTDLNNRPMTPVIRRSGQYQVLRQNVLRESQLVTGLLDRLEVPAAETAAEPARSANSTRTRAACY